MEEPSEAAIALPAPPAASASPAADSQPVWHLGIDFGTTGLSAVLLDAANGQFYPLYWTESQPSESGGQVKFRLPTAMELAPDLVPLASDLASSSGIKLHDFKPFLNLGIPYQSPFSTASLYSHWEPVIQWSETQQIPLIQIRQALQALLSTLKSATCDASGREGQLPTILPELTSLIVGCPANASAAYRFNVRQAILDAGLIAAPGQVHFLEESIAALLSLLPASQSPDGKKEAVLPQLVVPAGDSQGNMLILNAGASSTELTLVHVPGTLENLTPGAFQIRSIPYGGNAIDQDILCQLICSDLELKFSPNAGEPDLAARYGLQQQLESSGQGLLEAARQVKLTLQHQSQVGLELESGRQVILRQDLGGQVLLPYIQRLNRELNNLLTQARLAVTDVNQVICTGGTASLGAIARWLRQKLPNATIVQDTYQATLAGSGLPGSRVAHGLAALPLHPQLFDPVHLDDYTLLLAILRAFPEQPLSLEALTQQLTAQGISATAHQSRIRRLLDNHLPVGLVPPAAETTAKPTAETVLFTSESLSNPDYQVIAPLFKLQSDRTYQLNRYQGEQMRRYLEALLETPTNGVHPDGAQLQGARSQQSAQ